MGECLATLILPLLPQASACRRKQNQDLYKSRHFLLSPFLYILISSGMSLALRIIPPVADMTAISETELRRLQRRRMATDESGSFGRLAHRLLSGDLTCEETHVPIPNTTVKLAGPMIVPKARK